MLKEAAKPSVEESVRVQELRFELASVSAKLASKVRPVHDSLLLVSIVYTYELEMPCNKGEPMITDDLINQVCPPFNEL